MNAMPSRHVRAFTFFALLAFFAACGGDDDAGFDSGVIGGEDGGGADAVDVGPVDAARDVATPRPDSGAPACGDRIVNGDEACDDGNTESGDGCSNSCAQEENFVCVEPGEACIRVVTCGNGRLEGDETCDDRNDSAGDGCDSECHIEEGWACPFVARACAAAECGDGFMVDLEGCDDGNVTSGDGCSDTCVLEEGFVCAGVTCTATTCGDGIAEGTERCDDGNLLIGDGCTPLCTREPSCSDGTCEAFCGDSVVFAPETCDDGNTQSGDGCSADCQVEDGFACVEVPLPDADEVLLPVVIRDFMGSCAAGSPPVAGAPGAMAPFSHPDFQCFSGAELGMVGTTLVDGRPVFAPPSSVIDSSGSFAQWYQSDDNINRTVAQTMTLPATGGGTYQFDSLSFFPLSMPLDGSPAAGFVAEGIETAFADGNSTGLQNFFFTSEVRYWFEYSGDEVLAFSGDDDVWVFINGRLAVDIGGVHGRLDGSITLSDCESADESMNAAACLAPLDLREGGIYEAVVFQAERHTTRSQYRLTLANFNQAPSTCDFTCGDEIVTRFEACDDGDANGAEYNGCSLTCELTPYCGDGEVQEEFGEVCDDGLNLGAGPSGCAPGCTDFGARCGDGVTQTDIDEECDDGNTESGDGCSDTCRLELI